MSPQALDKLLDEQRQPMARLVARHPELLPAVLQYTSHVPPGWESIVDRLLSEIAAHPEGMHLPGLRRCGCARHPARLPHGDVRTSHVVAKRFSRAPHQTISLTPMMIFTNLRPALPVDQQSIVRPLAWRVVQRECGTCYLVVKLPGGSLRITSELKSTNAATRVVITLSGRAYQLEEAPTNDSVTIETLIGLVRFALAGRHEDVSDQVWEFMLRSTH